MYIEDVKSLTKSGLDAGAIIAIVIGSLMLLAMILILVIIAAVYLRKLIYGQQTQTRKNNAAAQAIEKSKSNLAATQVKQTLKAEKTKDDIEIARLTSELKIEKDKIQLERKEYEKMQATEAKALREKAAAEARVADLARQIAEKDLKAEKKAADIARETATKDAKASKKISDITHKQAEDESRFSAEGQKREAALKQTIARLTRDIERKDAEHAEKLAQVVRESARKDSDAKLESVMKVHDEQLRHHKRTEELEAELAALRAQTQGKLFRQRFELQKTVAIKAKEANETLLKQDLSNIKLEEKLVEHRQKLDEKLTAAKHIAYEKLLASDLVEPSYAVRTMPLMSSPIRKSRSMTLNRKEVKCAMHNKYDMIRDLSGKQSKPRSPELDRDAISDCELGVNEMSIGASKVLPLRVDKKPRKSWKSKLRSSFRRSSKKDLVGEDQVDGVESGVASSRSNPDVSPCSNLRESDIDSTRVRQTVRDLHSMIFEEGFNKISSDDSDGLDLERNSFKGSKPSSVSGSPLRYDSADSPPPKQKGLIDISDVHIDPESSTPMSMGFQLAN